mgnify:CR=1 FL=1
MRLETLIRRLENNIIFKKNLFFQKKKHFLLYRRRILKWPKWPPANSVLSKRFFTFQQLFPLKSYGSFYISRLQNRLIDKSYFWIKTVKAKPKKSTRIPTWQGPLCYYQALKLVKPLRNFLLYLLNISRFSRSTKYTVFRMYTLYSDCVLHSAYHYNRENRYVLWNRYDFFGRIFDSRFYFWILFLAYTRNVWKAPF